MGQDLRAGRGGGESEGEEVSWVGGAFWWEVGFGMGGREGDGFVFFWEGGYLLYAFLLHITICTRTTISQGTVREVSGDDSEDREEAMVVS